MITETLSTLKIHKLTQAQYQRELEAGRIDQNALYLTPDEETDLSGYATVEALETVATNKADKNHTHKYAGSSSVGGAATSAEKLTTLAEGNWYTPVYFSGGIPYACQKLDESMLQWGTKNISGYISPLDMACSNIHSANRFAFAKPAGITIEYSTDNGSTWIDCGVTDVGKTALVSGIDNYLGIGNKTTSDSATVNDKLRITLDATTMGVYTGLRKLLILISTNGATGCNVNIEKSLKADPSTYEQVGTYDITGWSGWNSIPFSNMYFGGGDSQTTNVGRLRLTFGITGVHDTYNSVLQVANIYAIGDNYWSTPSALARTGHVYTYDANQNVTFPAAITATQFNGTFNGTANNANNANNLNYQEISAPPTGEGCYPVNIQSSFVIDGITFPQYAKGMFVSNGLYDATLYVIDAYGNMYSAFRNGGEWRQASAVATKDYIEQKTILADSAEEIILYCGSSVDNIQDHTLNR